MNKLKLFIDNFVIYGLGGVISKIIPLIMLPIVTRMLPDSTHYGLYDLSNTILQFATALCVLGMYDTIYRMYFEKDDEDYRRQVCSTAFFITMCSTAIVVTVLVVERELLAKYVFGNVQYTYLVAITILSVLFGATSTIVSTPTRLQNRRGIYIFTNTLSPLVAYGVAVVLLLKGYYDVALPVGALLASISLLVVFLFLNHSWFSLKDVCWEYVKPMLKLGIPLTPSVLIYWIFSSSDRLILSYFTNMSEVGIYSVASKLGNISQFIYVAFAGGWQYFAFSTMKDANHTETISKVHEYLGIISYTITLFVAGLSGTLMKVFFGAEYYRGYIIVPILFFTPLIQMLFQTGGSQFMVIKKTWIGMLVLVCGAVVNIVLNITTIPLFGMIGAAISTLLGYLVTWIMSCIILMNKKLIYINKRFVLVTVLFFGFMLFWGVFISDKWYGIVVALVFFVVIVFFYYKDIKAIMTGLSSIVKKYRK